MAKLKIKSTTESDREIERSFKKLNQTAVNLGEKLQKKRDELGLNSSRISEQTGLSRWQVAGVMNGTQNYTIGTLSKVCNLLFYEL